MGIKSDLSRLAAVAAIAMAASTPASATIVAAVTSIGNSFVESTSLTGVSGMMTPMFFHPAGNRFIVTFSAECAVDAPDGNIKARSEVDIVLLNGNGSVVLATLAPTTNSASTNAFCSANGSKGYDGWANHSITAVSSSTLPQGFYRVQVRARLLEGATGAWFGERSLVVFR